jgi:AcrR family transcriptional regulator
VLETPKRDRRAERRQATKDEILDAAWELCAAEGLAGLSLRELAAKVGMQAPSLYSYFASKHEIYDAMFAQGARAMGEHTIEELNDSPTLEGLRYIAHYFADFCVSDPVRYQLLFQRTIPGFEPSPESFAISVRELERTRAWFALHRIDHALDLYTGLITGLVDQQISNEPGGDRWLRLIDDAMDMFLRYAKRSRK